MTQDDARRAIEALIAAWGGRDHPAAMKRAAAIVTTEESAHGAGSNVRMVRRWLEGHRGLSPETIAAISAMADAVKAPISSPRDAIEALIAAWGGRDHPAAMKRAAAIVTAEEVHSAGSNARFTRAWLDGYRDLSPQTIDAISAMAAALQGLRQD